MRVHHVRQGAPCPGPTNSNQTSRPNNGRYGYSGELAQCSSNQNRRWCCSSEADSVDSTPPIPAKAPRSGRAPRIRLPSLLATEQYQSLLGRLIFPLQVPHPAVFISVLAPAFPVRVPTTEIRSMAAFYHGPFSSLLSCEPWTVTPTTACPAQDPDRAARLAKWRVPYRP